MLINSNHNISFQQFLKRLWKFLCLPLLILNILSNISWKIILWNISLITCGSYMVWERDLLRYLLLLIMLMHAACLCMPLIEAASPMNVERWVWETMPDKSESKWLISLGILEIVKRESHLFSLSTVFLKFIYFFLRYNLILKCIV